MENMIIETFNLSKEYKLRKKQHSILALDNVNLSIKKGEIFGLLGPNGAGKTTLVQILTTILQPTSGYATIDGVNILKNPLQAKRNIALMLGSQMIYYRITGYDNLKFFCKIYKVPNYKEKIFKMAKEFGLEKWLKQYVENYSSGMKMKLALCRTFLLQRSILVLDEPTLGLDVKLKSYIINVLKNTDSTILLTSHDMGVVEKLCDRIAFINKGKIIKIGTKSDLSKFVQSEIKINIKLINNRKELGKVLEEQNYISYVKDTKKGFEITLRERKNYNKLLSILSKYEIQKINEHDLSLEDLFLNIII
ncbi:MAG: ABC transporter ATP-binding protein [Candidatus Lokiarchaeia archaeon]